MSPIAFGILLTLLALFSLVWIFFRLMSFVWIGYFGYDDIWRSIDRFLIQNQERMRPEEEQMWRGMSDGFLLLARDGVKTPLEECLARGFRRWAIIGFVVILIPGLYWLALWLR